MACMKQALWVASVVVLFSGCAEQTVTSPPPTTAEAPTDEPEGRINGVPPREVIALFGARLGDGATERQLAGYRRVFGFGDHDGDGRHSRQEYVDGGRYMTRQARQGIFRASDWDDDGFVTLEEYILNRIITDEAKLIFEDMDLDGDGLVKRDEFMANGRVKDQELCAAVFLALDTNGDGALVVPEYLRVWGRWARS